MGGAETAPPPQNNPGRDLRQYFNALQGIQPQLLGMEAQYRPQYGDLNLADQGQYLGGLLGLGNTANASAQGQIQGARTAELSNMLGNSGAVSDLLGTIDPTGAAAVNRAGTMAEDAYNRSLSLTPQERRTSDQTAREAFGARGRINDNVSVVGEILGREDVLGMKRQEAAQANSTALGMSQQFNQPALNLLGMTPSSLALGQDYVNSSSRAIGANTPQLVDTGAGISLGQQHASNLASWQQSNASAQNAQNAQNTQLAASALAAIASIYSDERAKTNIEKVGKTDDGLPIYTYNLLGSPAKQMGVMAQEVKKKQPAALGPKKGGLMTVNYSKIR